jgi:arylsulfatase A-like enzyme
MNTNSWAAILFALCAGNGLAGCETDARPFSVLLISVDTLRRDHVSAYGYDRPTTPALDALGREGAVFENASSTSNWTLPAHMSMLTGLFPSSHRVDGPKDRLPPDLRTLAAAFRTAGHATGGFTSHIYLDEKYGFARGFDTYELVSKRRAEQVTAQAIEWLEQHSEEACTRKKPSSCSCTISIPTGTMIHPLPTTVASATPGPSSEP